MTWSKEKAESGLEKNINFLRTVRKLDKSKVASEVQAIHFEVFNKTDCLTCANCCKSSPPIVTKKDAKRMGIGLKMPPKTVIKTYLINDVDGSMMMNGVPCTFLNSDNTCQIYEYRPNACRQYPHTDETDYALRPSFNAENTIVCPAAYEILQRLKKVL